MTHSMKILPQNTASDNNKVANIATTTISVTAQLASIMRVFKTVKIRLNALDVNNNNSGQGGHGGVYNDESYCHIHERTRRFYHTIATLNNKSGGHVDTTTLANRQQQIIWTHLLTQGYTER